ncbi:MAG: sigma-54 dependent transcriptional regulator [Acidobacteriota bacterium]
MSDRARLTVLVVEDESDSRQMIVDSLEAAGFAAAQAPNAADALARLDGFAYDALVVDVQLPDGDGLDLLDEALARYPDMRCVVTTGFGSIDHAVRALKRGAVDFLIKPFQLIQLVQILKTSLSERRLQTENAELKARLNDRLRFGNMIGGSQVMKRLFNTLELVAPMNSTVLIQGETGTGKELVARTVHYNSPRRDHPFVAFNAAAIPEGLAEAELFGHVKGAFTGAVNARVGRFELADKGTLFIDEVSSMSMALQAKLLRALQEREVERVGTSKPLKINARVVAATNEDLLARVREGTFREDLYYRLNVVRVVLPPLRERREDIAVLAQHFVQDSCSSNNLSPKTLSQGALRLLMNYQWPGNIRHLQNAIEHAVTMSGASTEILAEALPDELMAPTGLTAVHMPATPDEGINFTSTMSQVERELILRYLAKANGNKRQAARLLNLSRTTLIDKLHRLGVTDTSSAA